MKTRDFKFGWSVALIAFLPSIVSAEISADVEKAKAIIWEKEKAIYEGRSRGDLSIYLNNASDEYVGWPPGAKVPADLTLLKRMAASVSGQNQELLTMELADFTLSGTTAVIYYHTHRTRLPDGRPVDQRFAICHVWALENGEWKLVGALGRLKPENEYRDANSGDDQ